MQQKLIGFFLSLLLLSLFTSNASAETATSGAASKLREQMQLIKDQRQTEISKIKTEAKMDLKQKIRDAVQAKKLEVKTTVEAKREEFKAKLETIKDEKKKILVERIDAKLSSINTKHTDRFTQVLSNLQTLLDKISQSTTNTDVLADVTTAQTAINAAEIAVETQAAKTYTITISTEIALRSNVGTTTSQLRKDLVATHKLVVDAKQAVQALRKDKVILKKEATSSANL